MGFMSLDKISQPQGCLKDPLSSAPSLAPAGVAEDTAPSLSSLHRLCCGYIAFFQEESEKGRISEVSKMWPFSPYFLPRMEKQVSLISHGFLPYVRGGDLTDAVCRDHG